ncbi:MAG: hypothetical protein OEM26_11585, partial [Saprospiraceae bacterium]|nr:hypothetical protein [Saprospiraceae bacterium]
MRSLSPFLLLAIFLLAGCETKTNKKLYNLQAELIPNQLGLSLDEIRFSWSQDTSITSYRILVASDRALLKKEIGDLWDSERRFTRESKAKYEGQPIPSPFQFFWMTQVWANDAAPVSSAIQAFRTPEKNHENIVALLGGNLISSME